MNAEVYSEWLKRQGRRVVRSHCSLWHGEDFRSLRSFPYHVTIRPSERELADLTSEQRASVLYYSSPATTSDCSEGYHVVLPRQPYTLETLRPWARKNVRRGTKNCTIERISFNRYLNEGWELREDTLRRQRRNAGDSEEKWRRRFQSAADLPGFEIWAAIVGNRLAATLVTFRLERCCYYVLQQCHRKFLSQHVNNSLTFHVTEAMINSGNFDTVFYGTSSLDAPPSVDEFKLRMGFQAHPVSQQVYFHKCLSPFVNRTSRFLVRRCVELRPASRIFRKINGLISKSLGYHKFQIEPR